MPEKGFGKKLLILLCGMLLDAAGVALMTKSDFGISAVSSVAHTLSCIFPGFTFGVWSYIWQFFLFLLMCILVRRCSILYLISFLVSVGFGYMLDFCRAAIEIFPMGAGFRILYFISGMVILITGVTFLMLSDMPIMPQDLFSREISEHYRIPFSKVKTSFDMVCVLFSLIFSLTLLGSTGGLGAGTIFSALTVGNGVGIMKRWIGKKSKSEKKTSF